MLHQATQITQPVAEYTEPRAVPLPDRKALLRVYPANVPEASFNKLRLLYQVGNTV